MHMLKDKQEENNIAVEKINLRMSQSFYMQHTVCIVFSDSARPQFVCLNLLQTKFLAPLITCSLECVLSLICKTSCESRPTAWHNF